MLKWSFIVGALAGAVLISVASFAADAKPSPPHAKPMPPSKVAPADEYFGRMKMSILGITNSIKDTGIRESNDPANASKYYSGLAFTEEALEDWADKYPQDSWIPRRAYDLSHEFWLMHTPEADATAERCRVVLFTRFPHDRWAAIARTESALKVAPVASAAVQADTPAKQP
jgi:hypothetical protein